MSLGTYHVQSEVAQSCPTLCDPISCSLPGSSVHGLFQARILEWVAISFSRRSSQPRDWNQVSCIVGRHFTIWAIREVLSCPKGDQLRNREEGGYLAWIKTHFVSTGSVGKDSACNAGDAGLIPGLDRSPGGGNSSPLHYSFLGNPMDKGAWRAAVHEVARVGHNLATKPPPPQWVE